MLGARYDIPTAMQLAHRFHLTVALGGYNFFAVEVGRLFCHTRTFNSGQCSDGLALGEKIGGEAGWLLRIDLTIF